MEDFRAIPQKQKIIAENSPEHKRIINQPVSMDAQSFGSRLIRLKELDGPPSVIAEEVNLLRSQIVRTTLNRSKAPFVKRLLTDFIEYSTDESKPEAQIEKFSDKWGELMDQVDDLDLGRSMRDPRAVSGIISKLPVEQLQQLIVFHNKNFERSRNRFEARTPGWKSEFTQKAEAAIDAGDLPVSKDQLTNRMSKVKIVLGDGLNPIRSVDLYGSFNPDAETVVVFEQSFNSNNGRETVFHELMHALSGRTIYLLEQQGHENFGDLSGSGLGFYSMDLSDGKRFAWLSEGRTESLASKLRNTTPRFYPDERGVFDLLLTSGSTPLDERLFDEAYFEDFDPGVPPAQRVPKWKAMYDAVNRAYAPGFLLKLDQYVEEEGIDEAGFQIQQDWRVIQHFTPSPKAA